MGLKPKGIKTLIADNGMSVSFSLSLTLMVIRSILLDAWDGFA